MQAIDKKDRRTFDMIVAYLKAGGDPTIRNVREFCERNSIDASKFKETVNEPTWPDMEQRLRNSGLI